MRVNFPFGPLPGPPSVSDLSLRASRRTALSLPAGSGDAAAAMENALVPRQLGEALTVACLVGNTEFDPFETR